MEGWQKILRTAFGAGPEKASSRIIAAIDQFREKARPHDDVSFILLTR